MTTQTRQMTPARDYKSRMFTKIFSDKKNLLELYNAVSGRNYEDPELLTINTLENAIYMSMKNDISFLIDCSLSLYEHQSTYNPNMALRFLFYLADLYSPMVSGKNPYGTVMVQISSPNFIVFYNGKEERPEHEVMYLSDAYMRKTGDISLELKVDVFNINIGHNEKLLEASKTLHDYSEYIRRVRKYAETMSIEEEQMNTEREKQRADNAEERVANAEERVANAEEEIRPLMYFIIAPSIASVIQMRFYGVTSTQVGITVYYNIMYHKSKCTDSDRSVDKAE